MSDSSKQKPALDLVTVANVPIKPVEWLWDGVLARGKLSMLVGHPGQGKSTLTAAIAGIVSSGGRWPTSQMKATPGDVVILSTEDDIGDTLRPRLEAAGADLDRVKVLKGVPEGKGSRTFNLRKDVERLETLSADLLIIDPISSYLGGVDTHNNADVRSLLSPLGEIVEKKRMATALISHLNKSESIDTITRVSGSMAFVAVSRAVYIVRPDEHDRDRRLLLPLKNNLARDQEGFAFAIEDCFLEGGIQTSQIVWEPECIAVPDAFGGQTKVKSALEKAKDFLLQLLPEKPYGANEVYRLAEQAGHSQATIRRAAEALNIVKTKEGMEAGWVWSLPGSPPEDAQDGHASLMSTFEEDDHLRDATRQGG